MDPALTIVIPERQGESSQQNSADGSSKIPSFKQGKGLGMRGGQEIGATSFWETSALIVE